MIFVGNDTVYIQVGLEEDDYIDAIKQIMEEEKYDSELIERVINLYKTQSVRDKEIIRYIHPKSFINILKNKNVEDMDVSFIYSISIKDPMKEKFLTTLMKFSNSVKELNDIN